MVFPYTVKYALLRIVVVQWTWNNIICLPDSKLSLHLKIKQKYCHLKSLFELVLQKKSESFFSPKKYNLIFIFSMVTILLQQNGISRTILFVFYVLYILLHRDFVTITKLKVKLKKKKKFFNNSLTNGHNFWVSTNHFSS